MFERILLPLDGSELAEMTLPYGEWLARRLGSEVILFHACSPENKDLCHMHQVYLNSTAEKVQQQMRKGRTKGGQVKMRAEILLGEPIETIGDYVEKNDIGLMIMAASGTSGLKLWRLGSVAERVFRTVNIPTMLIRAPREEYKRKLINRILVPLDGSDASKIALPFAEELAIKLKASITLFQMAQRIYSYYVGYMGADMGSAMAIDYNKLDRAEERRIQAELLKVEKELRQKGIAVTHNMVSGTDPAHEIIETEKKVGADLVVMSTHGRSPIRRWVFGSVAEKVLREGEIPLLLVRQATS